MLLRIDDADDGTAETLAGCAEAVTELAARGLMAMVEPLPYHRDPDGSLRMLDDVASLARAVSIASGLGTTSAHTWLKMPACAEPGPCSRPRSCRAWCSAAYPTLTRQRTSSPGAVR
jgi:hypothetical protein